jgi:hypothetical protein
MFSVLSWAAGGNSENDSSSADTTPPQAYIWQWLDSSIWCNYSPELQQQLETARDNNQWGLSVDIREQQYYINLLGMTQRNKRTGYTRNIRRIHAPQVQPATPASSSCDGLTEACSSSHNNSSGSVTTRSATRPAAAAAIAQSKWTSTEFSFLQLAGSECQEQTDDECCVCLIGFDAVSAEGPAYKLGDCTGHFMHLKCGEAALSAKPRWYVLNTLISRTHSMSC